MNELVGHDIALLSRMLALVGPITPETNARLKTLKERLELAPLQGGKRTAGMTSC